MVVTLHLGHQMEREYYFVAVQLQSLEAENSPWLPALQLLLLYDSSRMRCVRVDRFINAYRRSMLMHKWLHHCSCLMMMYFMRLLHNAIDLDEFGWVNAPIFWNLSDGSCKAKRAIGKQYVWHCLTEKDQTYNSRNSVTWRSASLLLATQLNALILPEPSPRAITQPIFQLFLCIFNIINVGQERNLRECQNCR